MAQEFRINSANIESKINQLLPSQGGQGAGIDFSASTMVIPIVDLTETAEGSNIREDLQTSLSFTSVTPFSVTNASNTVVINTTGYYRVFGNSFAYADGTASCNLFDGATSKTILSFRGVSGADDHETIPFDFIVFIEAGNSFRCTSGSANATISGVTRQIATVTGDLVDPL